MGCCKHPSSVFCSANIAQLTAYRRDPQSEIPLLLLAVLVVWAAALVPERVSVGTSTHQFIGTLTIPASRPCSNHSDHLLQGRWFIARRWFQQWHNLRCVKSCQQRLANMPSAAGPWCTMGTLSQILCDTWRYTAPGRWRRVLQGSTLPRYYDVTSLLKACCTCLLLMCF